MFKGQYEHGLDAKGRVALPAVFRRELEERGEELLVVTPHIKEKCVVAYPHSEWLAFETKVAALSQFDPSAAQLRRLMIGRAQECPIDKVGRILLPAQHRRAAEIEKELVWMGQLRWIEAWSPAELEQVAPMAVNAPVSEETIAKLTELGL